MKKRVSASTVFPLPTEALRHGTEHRRQIQHVIVEGEVADG
jgi:hypothetical protein